MKYNYKLLSNEELSILAMQGNAKAMRELTKRALAK
jgi:hypothetical protein